MYNYLKNSSWKKLALFFYRFFAFWEMFLSNHGFVHVKLLKNTI